MRLHHLAFRTDDVDRLVAFYQHWLDLAIVRDARPRSTWLGFGESGAATSVLMIERRNPETDEPRIPSGSLELVAFEVDRARRVAIHGRLVAAGMLEAETEHTSYFRDPDGRRIGVSTFPLGPNLT